MNSEKSDAHPWHYWQELPPDKEEELIDKMAKFFIKNKIILLGQILFESISPISRIFSEIGLHMFGPFLDYFGVDTYTAVFRKRVNIQRIIDRMEELEREQGRNDTTVPSSNIVKKDGI